MQGRVILQGVCVPMCGTRRAGYCRHGPLVGGRAALLPATHIVTHMHTHSHTHVSTPSSRPRTWPLLSSPSISANRVDTMELWIWSWRLLRTCGWGVGGGHGWRGVWVCGWRGVGWGFVGGEGWRARVEGGGRGGGVEGVEG